MPRKAQTQVITIVLISGIVISLVGTAYIWGIPLISKRTAISDFLTAEDFLVKLNDKIVEIANSGSGESSLAIPKGVIRVFNSTEVNPNNNSIVLEVLVDQPLINAESVVYLKTNVLGEKATYGDAEPRVITLTSEPLNPGHKLILKLHYRELDTKNEPLRGYRIDLEKGSITGSNQAIVSYQGTSYGVAQNGGTLVITRIKVDVV
jgi:hypothetical protein